MARHASPILTASRYSKARPDRLSKLAEGLAGLVAEGRDYARGMQKLAAGAEAVDVSACDKRTSDVLETTGAGGLRPRPAAWR